MAKTATIGIRALVDYVLNGQTYSTGTIIEGARALSREVTQEITNQFADNAIYDSSVGVKTIAGEITTYSLHDNFYTDYLGFFKNLNGGFSDSNQNRKKAGLAFVQDYKLIASGQMVYKVNVMYDTSFTEPNIDVGTTEDSVEYTELVAAYSSKVSDFVVDDNGEKVSYYWFITPVGYSLDDVLTFLQTAIPTPTGALMPPLDTEAPVITVDTTPITTYTTAMDGTKTFGDLVVDAGISAIDNIDGDVTSNIVYSIGATTYPSSAFIDLSVIGSQTVNLNVVDSSLNAAIEETITITISI